MGAEQMSLKQFITKTRWTGEGGLDSRANYSGPDLSEWCQGPGRSRDSEILAESNFEAALERLGGEQPGEVEVHRFGHWGCGWFETIMVNPRNLKAIRELKAIYVALEHYPVLDDSEYSEREYEYQSNFADGAKTDLANALAMHFGLEFAVGSLRAALEDVAYTLNMECQMYAGNDSCTNVYTCREPDESDLKRLAACLKQCDFVRNTQCGPDSLEQGVKEYLLACLGEDED